MTFDCKKMHPKCKAQCCGVVPIPEKIYNNNKHKIVTQPIEMLSLNETFIPITKDSNCVFLNGDLSCNIYEDRPEICRKFGDESHPMLCCPYLHSSGKERTEKERRKIEKNINTFANKFRIL